MLLFLTFGRFGAALLIMVTLMRRIAAPMVGGMVSAPLLSMLVIPAAYLLMRRRVPLGASGVQESYAASP